MLFSEEFEVPLADTLAAERHHWELAGPEAFPLILCATGGSNVRHIEPWEFQLLEGCVRTIPNFVSTHPYSSAAPAGADHAATSSEVVSSNLKFTLSWVEPGSGDCDDDCGDDCGDDCDHCEE
jgi:hypothetical protein